MWKFEPYNRKETIIPNKVMASMRNGLEARYADRFRSYAGASEDSLKHADNARLTADSLRTAAGVVDTQKENIEELFMAAEMMVKMIDDFQRESGIKQIRNIPLAGASIKESAGKKLGYVKLAMKFVSAGLLHFMDISLNMNEDLKAKDKIIQAIAEHRVDVPIIGRLTEVELDELSSDDPIVETKLPIDHDDLEKEPLIPTPPITPPSVNALKKSPVRPVSPSPQQKSTSPTPPSKPVKGGKK